MGDILALCRMRIYKHGSSELRGAALVYRCREGLRQHGGTI